MHAITGTVLTLGVALVAALYALRATPRARQAPTPVILNQPHPCNITVCRHAGSVIVRERADLGGDTVYVCRGHWAEGLKRGWFQ